MWLLSLAWPPSSLLPPRQGMLLLPPYPSPHTPVSPLCFPPRGHRQVHTPLLSHRPALLRAGLLPERDALPLPGLAIT